ncbi:MAG TPA: hypothetical protein VJJ78_03910, partial [Candidatus Saccharimonadales bacterium]|nr:hypothetical protein [Candidatus Saccharimonadales bacterium]
WAEITGAIFKELGRDDLKIIKTTTEQYYADKPESAPRPLLSTFELDKIRAAGVALNDWREDLKQYIKKELKK